MIGSTVYIILGDMGVGFVVCTDGDKEAAQREADRLAAWMWTRRAEWVCELLDVVRVQRSMFVQC